MSGTPDPEERAAAFVAAARSYAERGWVLLDLDGKEPRRRGWQKTSYDAPELAAGKWSHWGRRANMGVLLGASGLAVVEPDTPEAHATLLELLGGELPATPVVISGGKSLHVYFVDGGQGNAAKDGLELRADRQQCVLPPSVHPETRRPYRWLDGHEPWTLSPLAIPEPVLAYFGANGAKKTAAPVGDEIPQGERYTTLRSLGGSMRHRGMSGDEIAIALLAVNAGRCKPPLPEREVAELAHDIARRYELAPPDPEQERIAEHARRLLEGEPAADAEPTPSLARRRQAEPLIVSLAEFLGGSEDDATWLVDHLAPRSALVLVAGLPKVGKSTFVYGLLGALTSAADRFVGLPAGSTSALLMTEEPPATVEEKVDRFGIDDERVSVISRRKMGAGRTWPKTVAAIVTFCRTHPEVGLIVIDTWDKFSGVSASRSEADTGVIIESIEPLWELLGLGVCVILITHQRKQEGEHGLRVRGGTALTGSVDVIAEVERPSQQAGLSSSARVVKIVSRYAGAPDEIAVELDESGWRSLGTVKAAARHSKREEILALLGSEPLAPEEILAVGLPGVSVKTVRRRLGELVENGLAERVGEGKRQDPHRWRLSENGRIFLDSPENGLSRNNGNPGDRAKSFLTASPPSRGEGGCPETGVHARQWLARDGAWRCAVCAPAAFPGEVVEERRR